MATRTIPFSVNKTDGTLYTETTPPTVTVQYDGGTASSLTATQQGSAWYVTINDTADACLVVSGTGIAPFGLTVLKTPASLDNLDTTVSSRLATSGYTAPANPTDYAKDSTVAKDATVMKAASYVTPPTVADIWSYASRSLTTFGTLVADVWAYATRALTDKSGFAPTTSDTATAVWATTVRSITDKVGFSLTSAYDRAKTALASTEYIAPPTDYAKPADVHVTVNPTAVTVNPTVLETAQYSALAKDATVMKATSYVAPDNAKITAIDAKTSQLSFTDSKVNANATASFPTDYMKSTDYTAPDNAKIATIEAKTSQLAFTNAKVNANAEATVDTQAIAEAVVLAMPPVEVGATINPNTRGGNGSPLGRVMPYGTVDVYLNGTDRQYRFNADADGDYTYTLPYGSTWVLKAYRFGYADTESTVSTVV